MMITGKKKTIKVGCFIVALGLCLAGCAGKQPEGEEDMPFSAQPVQTGGAYEERGTDDIREDAAGSGEKTDDSGTAEAAAFIKELYEAQTNREVSRIREGLEDDAVTDWALMLSTLYADDFGFQKYDDIEVKVYPVSGENLFAAFVAYDVIIEWNGEIFVLPGINTLLVRKSEKMQWRITSGDGLSDELAEEIYQMSISDELADWSNSISAEYYNIMARRPELADRLSEVASKAVQWVVSETLMEKDLWDYLFGEENGILAASLDGEEDPIYIVQKGDCLWSIAERELGDGKYWVKLYEANRDVIGENPDLLWEGMELGLA